MSYMTESVTIEEIAAVTKQRTTAIEAEARELGVYLGTDWAGRPCMTEEDAHGLVSGSTRAVVASEAEWKGHLNECAAWARRRDELAQAAGQKALEVARSRGHGGMQADAARREAAVNAGRDYELTVPVPTWQGEPSGNAVLRFIEAGERPSLLQRAARRVKAGAGS